MYKRRVSLESAPGFRRASLQHQFGGDGINGVVAVAAALAALGPALALGLEGGQAFIMVKTGKLKRPFRRLANFCARAQ